MMGSEVTDKEFTVILLSSLPDLWDTFTSSLLGLQKFNLMLTSRDLDVKAPEPISSFEVCGIILEEYECRITRGQSESVLYSQGTARSGKKPPQRGKNDNTHMVCHNCG